MVLVYLKNLIFQSRSPEAEDGYYSRVGINDAFQGNTSPLSQNCETLVSSPTVCFSENHEAQSYFSRIDPRVISDSTIGLSDGLTVPFALTAGLSALGDSKIVISGGLAELIAGAISMGLGGWLAARGEADAYQALLRSTSELVYNEPNYATKLLRESLAPLEPFINLENLDVQIFESDSTSPTISTHLLPPQGILPCDPDNEKSRAASDSALVNLLMRYHHCSPSAPAQARAHISAITIATAYFGGGFIPLAPYFFMSEVGRAFWWSVAVMAVALGCFGAAKTWLTSTSASDRSNIKTDARVDKQSTMRLLLKLGIGGGQMILLGGLAAAAATGLVIAFKEGLS